MAAGTAVSGALSALLQRCRQILGSGVADLHTNDGVGEDLRALACETSGVADRTTLVVQLI